MREPGRGAIATRRQVVLGGAAIAAGAVLRPARAAARSIGRVAEGLTEPWAVAFLPGGGFLVTERGGRLIRFAADGARSGSVGGLPEVAVGGQGGLLDAMIPRDFARSRQVFLSYAKAQRGGAGTALGVGRLSADGARLEGFRVLFEMAPGGRGGRHFGSRIVELPDGTLALTTGDRGADARAQELDRHEGKVIRINRDGTVPPDNPFVGRADALPEIWSYGHRNPQGAALDAEGQLWISEHGPRGGDEINLIRPGLNYGWPVTTHGRAYSGLPIGVGPEAPGMEPPAHHWTPSIAPSGHAILSGRMFPDWRGRHVVGSLNADHLALLDPTRPGEGGWAQERIATGETLRVRDVREAPDGAIWFLSVRNGALFRLARAGA